MTFTRVVYSLWLAGWTTNLLLVTVMFTKRRWRRFPIFTAAAGFEVIRGIILFTISARASASLYFISFWITEAVGFLLQLGLLIEVAAILFQNSLRSVFRLGSWVFILTVILTAVAVSFLPPEANTWHDTVDVRASLFTAFLTCELYLVISTKANSMRLNRGGHVMSICNGLALWSIFSLLNFLLIEGLGWHRYKDPSRMSEMILTLVILIYWVRSFWYAENFIPSLLPRVGKLRVRNFDDARVGDFLERRMR